MATHACAARTCQASVTANSRPLLPHAKAARRERNFKPAVCAAGSTSGGEQVLQAVPTPSLPPPGDVRETNALVMGAVMGLEAAALIGAVVTGVLARRRREEMQALNDKLRHINAELRRQRQQQESLLSAVTMGGLGAAGLEQATAAAPAAATAAVAEEEEAAVSSDSLDDTSSGDDSMASTAGPTGGIQAAAALEALRRQAEMLAAERSVLEQALAAPSAPHPTEGFGNQRLSIASARRRMAQCIRGGKELVRDGQPTQAFPLIEEGLQLAEDTADVRAERALIRVRARALRESGDPAGALRDLHRSLALSARLGETCGDADTYGEMGDLLTELGDLAEAGRYYDLCIAAIENEAQQPLSSTWDV